MTDDLRPADVKPPPRLLQPRRRLRSGLVQLACAAAGLASAMLLLQVEAGPTVQGGRLAAPLFGLGLGVMGVVTIVFSLLFGVVQWSASAFSPRLNIFRDDPLVWRTFGVTIGVFVYCVCAALAGSNNDQVSLAVPALAIGSALATFALIRALQTHAFMSIQLGHVLAAVVDRGGVVIDDVYPHAYRESDAQSVQADQLVSSNAIRAVIWPGPPGVVQQLDLRRLVEEASEVDALVVFRRGVGDPLHEGSVLADVHHHDLPDSWVCGSVVRGVERSFDQDPMLAIRLLADIALRALSTSINDPATAVDALDATHGLLRTLVTRDLEVADVSDRNDTPRVRLVLPSWEDFVRTGLEGVVEAVGPSRMVLMRVQRLLTDLSTVAPSPRRPVLDLLSEQVVRRLEPPVGDRR